jgi:hypothetical protein
MGDKVPLVMTTVWYLEKMGRMARDASRQDSCDVGADSASMRRNNCLENRGCMARDAPKNGSCEILFLSLALSFSLISVPTCMTGSGMLGVRASKGSMMTAKPRA